MLISDFFQVPEAKEKNLLIHDNCLKESPKRPVSIRYDKDGLKQTAAKTFKGRTSVGFTKTITETNKTDRSSRERKTTENRISILRTFLYRMDVKFKIFYLLSVDETFCDAWRQSSQRSATCQTEKRRLPGQNPTDVVLPI